MSAHTPSPWHTEGVFLPGTPDAHVTVWSAPQPGFQSGDEVAKYVHPRDARLIAAAPELLAVAIAYQDVRKLQAAYFKARTQENLIASKQAERALDAQASAAIAKTTGEAS